MKTQYGGTCKLCGSLWAVGDDIFYQKEPKAICSDEECYTQQGGKPYVPKGIGGGNTSQSKLTNVEQKMSNAGALDAQLANIAYERLKDVEAKFGEIAVPEKLIFLESWARTIAMSLR
jgi:hypothetical protein